jgi:hypothetical protein
MRNALPPNAAGYPRYGFTCQSCGRIVVTDIEGVIRNPQRGSTQRFCTPACRQAAFRRRRAGAAENQPRQHAGGGTRRLSKTTEMTEQGVKIQP